MSQRFAQWDEDPEYPDTAVDEAHSPLADWQAAHDVDEAAAQQQPLTVLFTVANPVGTVSVTASLGGRIHHVHLAPEVRRMTERSLAEEIAVIALLAQKRARAAVHTLIANSMTARGRDPAMIRSILEREGGLPSPESAHADLLAVFASRYAEDLG